MNHLDPDLHPIARMPAEERVKYILSNKWWVQYDQATRILRDMDRLLLEERRERMESILLIGEPNSGKTSILNEFSSKYPAYISLTEDGLVVPVLSIEAPAVPDERRFYDRIFRNTQTIYRKSDNLSTKHEQVINLLRNIKLKVLVIDEVHNLAAGSDNQNKIFLNLLRELSNELQLNLICAGTKEALSAVATDKQLSRRFTPNILSRWQADSEESYKFLLSIGRRTPLREATEFQNPDFLVEFFDRTEGILGEMVKLLRKAVIYALDNGEEKLTPSVIKNTTYTPPRMYEKLEESVYPKP